jgi:hypothetical protein
MEVGCVTIILPDAATWRKIRQRLRRRPTTKQWQEIRHYAASREKSRSRAARGNGQTAMFALHGERMKVRLKGGWPR